MKSIVTTETSQTPDPTPTQRNLGRILLRNTLAVISGDVAIRLLNVLFTIVTVRLLGDVGLGQYAMTIAFVGLFGVFFELGLTQYFERTIAQNPASTQSLFWNLVALRLMLAVGGVVVISGLAVLWGHEPSVVTAIILFSLTFLLSAFLSPLTTLFTANERFDISTGMQVVNQLITIVLGTVLLWLGFGFLALIYTGFVAMPIQILISIWAIRRYQLGPLPFQIAPASWGTFIKASIPFGITSLALTFNFNADTVILSFFRGAEEVGWYNAAYRMVFTLVALAGAFLTVMTPSFAREHVSNPENVRLWTRTSVWAMALAAFPIAVGTSILATPIVTLLYGATFAPTGPLLSLIVWDVPLLLFTAFCGNVTAAIGLEHPAARIYGLSAVLNIVLNMVFIPVYGVVAAAAITLITDGLTTLLFVHLLATAMSFASLSAVLARMALAAGLMGGVVWLVAPVLPLLATIAVGVVSYTGLVLWLRLVDRAMIVHMGRRLRRRHGV